MKIPPQDSNRPRIAKDSLTGKAMTYLHNQWDKLNVYCRGILKPKIRIVDPAGSLSAYDDFTPNEEVTEEEVNPN